MLYIIGLAHRAQSRKADVAETEAQQSYGNLLRQMIHDVRPVCLAEEDSDEALAERNEVSIAQTVAAENKIQHLLCDPTQQQRRDIGYKNGQDLELKMFMSGAGNCSDEQIRLKARAIEILRYFPIRERFWLDRFVDLLPEGVIFICGDGHIESFGRILDSNGIQYKVVSRGIGLTEEDDWFYEVLQYAKEHSELRTSNEHFLQ